jgi:hypothetical protein
MAEGEGNHGWGAPLVGLTKRMDNKRVLGCQVGSHLSPTYSAFWVFWCNFETKICTRKAKIHYKWDLGGSHLRP